MYILHLVLKTEAQTGNFCTVHKKLTLLPPKCKNTHFSGLPQQNSGSQDITIQIGFRMHVAKRPTYPDMCQFPYFVAICDHYPPTLYVDRQMDGHHAVNKTCCINKMTVNYNSEWIVNLLSLWEMHQLAKRRWFGIFKCQQCKSLFKLAPNVSAVFTLLSEMRLSKVQRRSNILAADQLNQMLLLSYQQQFTDRPDTAAMPHHKLNNIASPLSAARTPRTLNTFVSTLVLSSTEKP